jgi:hypothetical protein
LYIVRTRERLLNTVAALTVRDKRDRSGTLYPTLSGAAMGDYTIKDKVAIVGIGETAYYKRGGAPVFEDHPEGFTLVQWRVKEGSGQ